MLCCAHRERAYVISSYIFVWIRKQLQLEKQAKNLHCAAPRRVIEDSGRKLVLNNLLQVIFYNVNIHEAQTGPNCSV